MAKIRNQFGVQQASACYDDARKGNLIVQMLSREDAVLRNLKIQQESSGEYLSGFEDSSRDRQVLTALRSAIELYIKLKKEEAEEMIDFALAPGNDDADFVDAIAERKAS